MTAAQLAISFKHTALYKFRLKAGYISLRNYYQEAIISLKRENLYNTKNKKDLYLETIHVKEKSAI